MIFADAVRNESQVTAVEPGTIQLWYPEYKQEQLNSFTTCS
jgi:hypothetical protein